LNSIGTRRAQRGRYRHREFAYFLGVAKSSLAETQNHLIDGQHPD